MIHIGEACTNPCRGRAALAGLIPLEKPRPLRVEKTGVLSYQMSLMYSILVLLNHSQDVGIDFLKIYSAVI